MSAAERPYLTAEEYLALERVAQTRSQLVDGEMFGMAGASEEHVLINTNLVTALRTRLRGGPCRIYANDMRVKVSETGMYTYPDLAVACGERKFEDRHSDTLLNPVLIIEVLSPSTERYDRGGKFADYRRLSSLREYVLVSQDSYRVEHYFRQNDGPQWLFSETIELGGTLQLAALGIEVLMSEIYEDVTMLTGEDESKASDD